MIFLKDGNIPLNTCFDDEIFQGGNSTYQLTFKFPTIDDKWKLLREEVHLLADDLDGEQEFIIFEIQKQHGYITVYANQIANLLNYYVVSKINVDRVPGATVMSALASSIIRECPFTFYSDILDKHTFNVSNMSVMDALIKNKHSIVGEWGGDLVRDKYSIRLLKNGGSENESLFMYKKNLSSYEETVSTKSLRTRIHFWKKLESEEGKKEEIISATIDSPLIHKYKNIYEATLEVNDQDVKDLTSLKEYGRRYFQETLCDIVEDELELKVVGLTDVPVKIFDIVSVFHEQYEIDLRKKITMYRFSPMAKVLKSIGFGAGKQTLGSTLDALINDTVNKESTRLDKEFEEKLAKQIRNANTEFDRKEEEIRQELTDGIEQSKAEAERFKAEVSINIEQRINQSRDVLTKQLKDNFDGELKGFKDNIRDQIVGINERFDNFRIGRRNLLQGTRLLSKYNPFDAFNGYKITRSVAGPTGYRDTYSDVMTVSATSKEYVAVFYARASHNDYPIRCHMYSPNTGTTVETSTGYIASNNADGVALLKITKEWKPYWVKWGQNPTDKPKNIIIGRHGVQIGGIDGAWVEICAPALFEGNIVGTHEDAPEDAPNRNYVLNSGNTTIAEQLSLSSDLIKDLNQERTFTMSVEVEGSNIGPNPANNRKRYGFATTVTFTDDSMWYPEVWETVDSPRRRVARTWTVPTGKTIKSIRAVLINDTDKENTIVVKPKIELGRYMTSWEESPITFMDGKLAEYKRTLDAEFTKITEAMNGTVKKADVQITPNYISFGVGKQVDGKAISSLFVQQPDSINAIAKLFKVTGDMIVDGSITGKDLATNSITTGHLTTGSVTAKALAADSVTGDKLAVDSAMIKKLTTDNAFIRELTSKNAFITQIQSIDITANHIKGGRMTATNNAMMIDFETGQYNVYSNEAAFRRIDDTSSSQFIKMAQAGFIGEYIRDSKAALITVGTNHDKTENTENGSFAGTRLWSGKVNKVNESFYEIVSDRIAIYANGEKRSPWLFHNNTKDGKTYLLPMNEKGIRHYLGRGDKFFAGIYANDFYLSGGRSIGAYLWDLLTCFSQIKAAGWTFSEHSKRHIQAVLSKYGGQ